jgi:hypothetical protein
MCLDDAHRKTTISTSTQVGSPFVNSPAAPTIHRQKKRFTIVLPSRLIGGEYSQKMLSAPAESAIVESEQCQREQ